VRRGGRKAPKPKRLSKRIAKVAPNAQPLTIDLALLKPYAKYARRRGGLPAVVSVTYTPAGGAPQQRTISVRFAQKPLRTTTTTLVKAGT
jgi:hypothetical protein